MPEFRSMCHCGADSEPHTCDKEVRRLREALENIVCLDESCGHTDVFCVARKAQRALMRGPDILK